MSSRGATWRGRHEQRYDQKIRSRRGQRNRKMEQRTSELVDFPAEKLQAMVRTCRSKIAHASLGAAYAAKRASERDFGKRFYVYECPICGKWHLTTHPWSKGA